MIKKILLTPIDSGYVVMFLRTIALAFVVGLIFFIPMNWERNQYLIAPLGILISALLASFSVVLSIDTNIKLKKIEISNKIRNVFSFVPYQDAFNLFIARKEKTKNFLL